MQTNALVNWYQMLSLQILINFQCRYQGPFQADYSRTDRPEKCRSRGRIGIVVALTIFIGNCESRMPKTTLEASPDFQARSWLYKTVYGACASDRKWKARWDAATQDSNRSHDKPRGAGAAGRAR
mmetsp:Transcript_81014/g.217382  ORF Transcript_81014/g.217382 Transcript_81014/m.217382 type:complete len:125 (+) Transcript_81014:156-530(+)